MEDQITEETNLLKPLWGSYPKIWNFGHPEVKAIFDDPVIVEEKLDGSQLSFCVTSEGEVRVKSKNNALVLDAPAKMFQQAVDTVLAIQADLHVGWTYRGEYFSKPKHNTIAYERIPSNHIIIFDINIGPSTFLSYEDKKAEAERIGLECVPLLYKGKIETPEDLKKFLDTDSILGGSKVEGVVCKNYKQFCRDGKAVMAKHVSEKFKERNMRDWKLRNPGKNDLVQSIIVDLRTDARLDKAIQHLRDDGVIENTPRDIGNIMKEIHKDLDEECAEDIKEKLFRWAMPKIKRGVCHGVAEAYKQKLMARQFEELG